MGVHRGLFLAVEEHPLVDARGPAPECHSRQACYFLWDTTLLGLPGYRAYGHARRLPACGYRRL